MVNHTNFVFQFSLTVKPQQLHQVCLSSLPAPSPWPPFTLPVTSPSTCCLSTELHLPRPAEEFTSFYSLCQEYWRMAVVEAEVFHLVACSGWEELADNQTRPAEWPRAGVSEGNAGGGKKSQFAMGLIVQKKEIEFVTQSVRLQIYQKHACETYNYNSHFICVCPT